VVFLGVVARAISPPSAELKLVVRVFSSGEIPDSDWLESNLNFREEQL
jgi:hypothetical protein